MIVCLYTPGDHDHDRYARNAARPVCKDAPPMSSGLPIAAPRRVGQQGDPLVRAAPE
jgi:hypothetical protein